MKNARKRFTVSVFVILVSVSVAQARDLKYSTVFIGTAKGSGSGVPVQRIGNTVRILTAEHVIRGFSSVEVRSFTPSSYPYAHKVYNGHVVSSGPNDVAVVEVVTTENLHLLPIARHGPKVGDTVYYAGCAGGRSPTSHTAQLSRIDIAMYVTNVAPAKGQSGGPLVNTSGEVIGVANVQHCNPLDCYAGGFALLGDLQLALHREKRHPRPSDIQPLEQSKYLVEGRPGHPYSSVTINGNTVIVHGTGVRIRSSGSVVIIQH